MNVATRNQRFTLLLMAGFLSVTAIPLSTQAVQTMRDSLVQVKVNDQVIAFPDAKAYIDASSSRTMVPVRFVSEALGAKVDWEQATQQVRIAQGNKNVHLFIGQNRVDADGKTIYLDTKPLIKEARTYVPLRFVSEALGAKVVWNETARIVSITMGGEQGSTPVANLTLEDTVQAALANNKEIKQLRIDVSTADVNAKLVSAKVKEIPDEFVGSLDTAQQKYINEAKAQMAKRVNHYFYSATEGKTKLGAQKVYFDLLYAKAELALKRQSLQRAETQLKMAEIAFQVGTRAKTDVLQAEAGLAAAQAAIAVAQSNYEMARIKLNEYIGTDLNKHWTLAQVTEASTETPIKVEEAIERAKEQRAEVLQKIEEVKVAERNRDLVAMYSALSTYPGIISINDVEKAKLAVEDAKRDVEVEVMQAYYNLQSANVSVEAYKKAKEATQETYRLTNLRYENGLSTILEVIQAEEELSTRENQYENAQHTYKLALASYANAMGTQQVESQ